MHIDLVSESQHESLIDLLCELHSYYNPGPPVSRSLVREHLQDNLLATDSPHRLVVASDKDGKVIGLAAISLVFSLVDPEPDKRRHCLLKELYVCSSARSQGAGKALMAWVARYAWEHGCRRIDWPVKASNTRGQAFYESLGAERVVDRLSYRLAGPQLEHLAQDIAP